MNLATPALGKPATRAEKCLVAVLSLEIPGLEKQGRRVD